jgi:cell division protein FtsI (penicillin-binding protein 3)
MQKSPSRTKFRTLRNLEFTRQRKFFRENVSGNGTSKTTVSASNLKFRLLVVWGVLMAAGLGLALNLYRLQIIEGSKLTQRARNQQMVNVRPFMPRRPVVDRNKNIVAIDRPVYTLYAHPKLFDKSQEEMAQQIAPILNKDPGKLVNLFQSKRSGILPIA